MIKKFSIQHQHTQDLLHNDDCKLLGMTTDRMLYVEEIYSPDDWITQHSYNVSHHTLTSRDENYGKSTFTPLELPHDLISSSISHQSLILNYSGGRLRGLREADSLSEWVQQITVMDKMAVIQKLGLSIPAMMVFGIAESRVLATAQLDESLYFVCRRLHIAIALPEVKYDDDQHPYDYDTVPLYIVHWLDSSVDEPPSLNACLNDFKDYDFNRPMDCLYHDGLLYIADGGSDEQVSRIHIFEVS